MSGPKRPSEQDKTPAPDEDEVEEASEESFPASDPPSWTPTRAGGTPKGEKKEDKDSSGGKKPQNQP